MGRLTEWINGKAYIINGEYDVVIGASTKEAITKLAEYEDAEEEGRLIVFPVTLGDHVYCFPSETEHYREMQVIGLDCGFSANYIYVQDVITCETVFFDTDSLGRSMFKTLDEAEAKLKELEDDNG